MYKTLGELFSEWKTLEDIDLNINGLIFEKGKFSENSYILSGDINREIAKTYTNKIAFIKQFDKVDFCLSGYKNKEYGVEKIEYISMGWDIIKTLISNSKELKELNNNFSRINYTVIEVKYKEKSYFLLAKQIPTETLYKKRNLFFVKDRLESINKNQFFAMTNNIDCIIDEDQKCFYSLNNNEVIKVFDLEEKVKQDVISKSDEIREWQFIKNINEIIDVINQKNVYRPLFRILKDENYVSQLNNIKPNEFKNRLIRVSNNEFLEECFEDDKIVINSKNRSKFLKLLAKQMKYNIATDTVE